MICFTCVAVLLFVLCLHGNTRQLFAQSNVVTPGLESYRTNTQSVAGNQLASKEVDDNIDTADQALSPLHIVLLADNKDHGPAGNGFHDYPRWQKKWAGLLLDENLNDSKSPKDQSQKEIDRQGARVLLSTAWGWPSDEQFNSADVIVSYCYLQWTEQRIKQFRRYLENGGGVVLIHSSTWTKPEALGTIAQLTGVGGFTLYRRGRVQMELVEGDHPICAGLPETIVLENDETYWPPTPMAHNVTVIATSIEGKGAKGSSPRDAQPILWCYELGKGRVFGCVPGHCIETFDNPEFRQLLLRGICWAAGRELGCLTGSKLSVTP